MNATGQLLRLHVPEFVRRRALLELFAATAGAFGASVPALDGAHADDVLATYAAFTAGWANEAIDGGRDLVPIKRLLFDSAFAIGARLRRELGIGSVADAMTAGHVVYGILRIDFRRAADGDVRIRQCFFSQFYSPPVCELMSSLDQGLVAGLTAGGRLEFRRRITEGARWCEAGFTEARG